MTLMLNYTCNDQLYASQWYTEQYGCYNIKG